MIQGKKINLRLVKQEDIAEINILANNLTERGEYLGIELSAEIVYKKYYNDNGFWQEDYGKMLITDNANDILGHIVFFKGVKGFEGYEIGCQIHKQKNRGKGYATEALRLFSAYIFELKPINRLGIRLFSGNVPSRIIAEKCGYVYEGTMRKAMFARGKYHDVQFFSILREECPPLDEGIK
ncbi:GNAT family N-acetyltransferase [Clostridium sp.]|uniref:GNAT family N-acetyltransferase n=1 Tax=Clostridium sp. TaxID=1506 RepID=UPI003D6D9702